MVKEKIDKRMIIVVAILLVAVIVVSVVLAFYSHTELNDNYFVTDANKVVLPLDGEYVPPLETETGYRANKVYTVYYCAGNNITSVKAFYRYENDEESKAAYEDTRINCSDETFENSDTNAETDETDGETATPICNSWASSKDLNGQYVILQYKEGLIEGITAKQVRDAAENNE